MVGLLYSIYNKPSTLSQITPGAKCHTHSSPEQHTWLLVKWKIPGIADVWCNFPMEYFTRRCKNMWDTMQI